jgi:hypothetical protein
MGSIGEEYRLHHKLNTHARCPNIIDTRGYAMRQCNNRTSWLGYMYLEWAPFKSLADLVDDLRLDVHDDQ